MNGGTEVNGLEWGLYFTQEDFKDPHAAAERKTRGKSQVQCMYEFFTGGLRPPRPAAKVVEFPDPTGHNRARLEAWADAIEFVERKQREQEVGDGPSRSRAVSK
jgi:hypothetical protein